MMIMMMTRDGGDEGGGIGFEDARGQLQEVYTVCMGHSYKKKKKRYIFFSSFECSWFNMLKYFLPI